jgi:hypothetical protein
VQFESSERQQYSLTLHTREYHPSLEGQDTAGTLQPLASSDEVVVGFNEG